MLSACGRPIADDFAHTSAAKFAEAEHASTSPALKHPGVAAKSQAEAHAQSNAVRPTC